MKVFLRKFLLSAVFAAILTGFSTCYAAGGKMPVLMYHDLTNDPAKTNSMTITGERFRLDMEFLKEFGYTPLLPADLIAIRQGAMELPEKPVMITFDDGYRSNYDIAYPVLQQTGMKATIAVVAHNMAAEDTADPVRTHLLWSEMREMVESGLVEIGSHTYNLHNPQHKGNSAPDGIDGVMRLGGESKAAYRMRVGTDLVTSIELIRQNTGQAQVNYFSYPFGGIRQLDAAAFGGKRHCSQHADQCGAGRPEGEPVQPAPLWDQNGDPGIQAVAADRHRRTGAGHGVGQRRAEQAAGI